MQAHDSITEASIAKTTTKDASRPTWTHSRFQEWSSTGNSFDNYYCLFVAVDANSGNLSKKT